MKEAIFNTELKNSLIEAGATAHKIPDMPTGRGVGMRFNPEKPCDLFFIYKRIGGLIEGKQIKKFEAFGLRNLRPNQIRALDDNAKKGNPGFVFLNIRVSASEGVKAENRLIIFEWKKWRKNWEIESIPATVLKDFPFIQGKHGRFNLTEFLQEVKNGM